MTTNQSKSNHNKAGVNHKLLTPAQAKSRLIKLGWTHRAAAPVLGIKNPKSLCFIVNGKFQNKRVLRAIAELGPSGRNRYERKPITELAGVER